MAAVVTSTPVAAAVVAAPTAVVVAIREADASAEAENEERTDSCQDCLCPGLHWSSPFVFAAVL